MTTNKRRLNTIVCLVGAYRKGDKRPPASAGYLDFHAWADAQGRTPSRKTTRRRKP